jgi:hypothetical protein
MNESMKQAARCRREWQRAIREGTPMKQEAILATLLTRTQLLSVASVPLIDNQLVNSTSSRRKPGRLARPTPKRHRQLGGALPRLREQIVVSSRVG